MSISLIITCFNEASNIEVLLNDVLLQTVLPSEMIVVDAGSRDGTAEILQKYISIYEKSSVSLRVEIVPGASISRGRNRAIETARGSVIAVTDAGCRLEPTWLGLIAAPILSGEFDLAGGFFSPVSNTRFQDLLAMLTVADSPGKGFLPSSRSVAFTKDIWEKVGGYPEWLKWGEDTLFDELCIRAGARYTVEARALVHWEVRRNLREVTKQFRRYAYGDGLARRATVSLLSGPCVYLTTFFCAFYFNFFSALFLPVAFAASWVIRRKKIRFSDYIYALALAGAIQVSRTIGFVMGCIHSVVVGKESK